MSGIGRRTYPLRHGRVNPQKHELVTSMANGFDFDALSWEERHWLRKRRLVNHTGAPTEKGHEWARILLAREADALTEIEHAD